ncbi:MAG: Asp-tRNA(Asn)/Glu-tRNA(Gln) amidotransferase subunit GatC [Actinomycetota bacterium]|nr:Asp-tRNA(Asn)/Glu-tRNA(Gln) amidotransferase subunit GatC [Actinomycetota bacterium]
MERISKDDVRHVAKLAELELEEKDLKRFVLQLDKVLDYVAEISSVDTEGVAPTSHVLDVKNVFRDDEPGESFTTEYALKNAPDEVDGGFKVPKID